MYDMNDVIISLGGIEHILKPCTLDVTDNQLENHLSNNVIGNAYTVAEVRAQENIYAAQIEAAEIISSPPEPTKEQLLAQLQALQAQIEILA